VIPLNIVYNVVHRFKRVEDVTSVGIYYV